MFQHFPHIEGFHNVVKSVTIYPKLLPNIDSLTYRAKVKLHGTNAAIQIRFNGNGGLPSYLMAQSRSRIISSGDDNMGFGLWFEDAQLDWDWEGGLEQLYSLAYQNNFVPVTIFGEWCGQGIMKGVAVSQIDTKIFCVFAIQIGESNDESGRPYIITDPEQIMQLVPIHPQIKVIPYLGFTIRIDYSSPETLPTVVDFMNDEVAKIEKCDPFIKEQFNIEGIGEGLVFYPIIDNSPFIKRDYFSDLTFKAKGEKHKVTKQREAVQIDPEIMTSISEFVKKTVTVARMEQGVREVARGELEFNMKLIGPFLGWIGKDIKRETSDELEASELNWRMVQKQVVNEARTWYMAKCKEL